MSAPAETPAVGIQTAVPWLSSLRSVVALLRRQRSREHFSRVSDNGVVRVSLLLPLSELLFPEVDLF